MALEDKIIHNVEKYFRAKITLPSEYYGKILTWKISIGLIFARNRQKLWWYKIFSKRTAHFWQINCHVKLELLQSLVMSCLFSFSTKRNVLTVSVYILKLKHLAPFYITLICMKYKNVQNTKINNLLTCNTDDSRASERIYNGYKLRKCHINFNNN